MGSLTAQTDMKPSSAYHVCKSAGGGAVPDLYLTDDGDLFITGEDYYRNKSGEWVHMGPFKGVIESPDDA